MTSPKQFFAFFGDDAQHIEKNLIEKMSSEKVTYIPLDIKALEFLKNVSRERIIFLEDFIGHKKFCHLQKKSEACANFWHSNIGNKFLDQFDINLPYLDNEAMQWFWDDAIIAIKTADTIIENKNQLTYFKNTNSTPYLFYYQNSIASALWEKLLINNGTPIDIQKNYSKYNNSLLYHDFHGKGLNHVEFEIIRGKLVFLLHPGEYVRYENLLEELKKTFPKKICINLVYENNELANTIKDRFQIPVLQPPQCQVSDWSIFQHLYDTFNTTNNVLEPKILKILDFHFKYYFFRRWPQLFAYYKSWKNIFSKFRPLGVVGSSLNDAESRIGTYAAHRENLSTFILPHGLNLDYQLHNSFALKYAKYILNSYRFSKACLQNDATLNNKIVFTKGLELHNEYPEIVMKDNLFCSNKKILVLLNPCNRPQTLRRSIGFANQIKAINDIASIKKRLGAVQIKFKVHPGIPNKEIFDLSEVDNIPDNLAPLNTSLYNILTDSDLIICLNYSGAAVIHASVLSKPIIFYWNDPIFMEKEKSSKTLDIVSHAGIITHTKHELLQKVFDFFNGTETAATLGKINDSFKQNYIFIGDAPFFGEFIKQKCCDDSNAFKPQIIKPMHLMLKTEKEIFGINRNPDYGEMPVHEQIILAQLVKSKSPESIFEFGTFLGASTLRLAMNCSAHSIYTIDLPVDASRKKFDVTNDPELDVYPDQPGIKFLHTPYATKITQLLGNTLEYDYSPHHNKFDFVFVDACHHYQYVKNDSNVAFKLIKDDGMIIWHDYADYAPGVIRALDELVKIGYPLFQIEGTSFVVYDKSIKKTTQSPKKIDSRKNSKKYLSIIIPTLNRAHFLQNTLNSIASQSLPSNFFEIIVVDNDSSDNTEEIVSIFKQNNSHLDIRFFIESIPGLLSGRHLGAIKANGEILVFIDDDIEATQGWLQSIFEEFRDPSVHLVGGPSQPLFEKRPPKWMQEFFTEKQGNIHCGWLSLAYHGEEKIYIDPSMVWGLNFSIRKTTLFKLGGFHPDCIPRHLQYFQGDGETGLSFKLKKNNMLATYVPEAKVFHIIPTSRLTVDYFKNRFFYQGVCDSYTYIRTHHKLDDNFQHMTQESSNNLYRHIYEEISNSYVNGYLYHQSAVQSSKILLDWVLRDNYLDYRLPELEDDFTTPSRNMLETRNKFYLEHRSSKIYDNSITKQLHDFDCSDITKKQSYYEKAKNPLDNIGYFNNIKETLIEIGMNVIENTIDINDFEKWMSEYSDISTHYNNLGDVFIQKCLEHYMSYTYLNINFRDIYIDIAAAGSPWAPALNTRGIQAYRLDLSYPPGINGINIGANATATNLRNECCTALSMQCAYECFMGAADQEFFTEAHRILAKKGRILITPLYIENTYFISTSPYCDQKKLIFDNDALVVWRDDDYKIPFCRMYSPESFYERIYRNILDYFEVSIYFHNNIDKLLQHYSGQRIYSFFSLYCIKK